MDELNEMLRLVNNGVVSEEEMDDFFDSYLEMYVERRSPQSRRERHGEFNLAHTTDEDVVSMFRFHREDLATLQNLLEIPSEISLPERCRVSGLTALCITLRRLTYPNRLSDLERIFGYSVPYLSRVVKSTVALILHNKGHLLDDLRNLRWMNEARIQYYAEAIHGKGAALSNCWGFIDGTARKICRPTVNQELYYSGHKRYHALKYQSIMAPDGIIVSLSGSYPGREHDAAIWRASRIEDQIRDVCVFPNRRYVLYGDAAYPLSNLLITPYSARQREEPAAAAFNQSMSLVRQAVEWGFGKVIREFAFVDFSKNQRLLLQDVGGMYKVAVLLANCHSCLYGSQISHYFGTNPPTLAEYLRQ